MSDVCFVFASGAEKEPQKIFELKAFFGSNPGTPEYYDEVSRRIIKFSSF